VAVLSDLLKKKKGEILERWFRLILETYSSDTARILRLEKDEFVNPVGATLTRQTEVLYGELLGEMNSERIASALEQILRIRSVQDFSPSQSVLFVPLLKKAIQEELAEQMRGGALFGEWLGLESKIDRIFLLAVDLHGKCRETIYEIRLREMKHQKDRAFKLMARSGLGGDEE
jgi:hypothetical protein